MLSNIASGIRTLFSSAPGFISGSSLADCDFWQRKMLTHFKRMDLNGDGFVSRCDFKGLIKCLANKAKLSEQRAFLMQRCAIQLWEDFWCCGEDKGFDYCLPPEEFVELMVNLHRLTDSKKQLEEPLSLIFGVLDLDGNGLINLKEWTVYYEALGLSEKDAIESFEHCFEGKQEVSKVEFISVGQSFFTSTDERHPSRLMWGPLVD